MKLKSQISLTDGQKIDSEDLSQRIIDRATLREIEAPRAIPVMDCMTGFVEMMEIETIVGSLQANAYRMMGGLLH